jgi:PAS domain-containing protein
MECPWVKELAVAVTVCDREGKILFMNDGAYKLFKNSGGFKLVGSNVLDCHPERVRAKVKYHLDTEETYTFNVEENGSFRIVHGTPWYGDGKYGGFVEISFHTPERVPTFRR